VPHRARIFQLRAYGVFGSRLPFSAHQLSLHLTYQLELFVFSRPRATCPGVALTSTSIARSVCTVCSRCKPPVIHMNAGCRPQPELLSRLQCTFVRLQDVGVPPRVVANVGHESEDEADHLALAQIRPTAVTRLVIRSRRQQHRGSGRRATSASKIDQMAPELLGCPYDRPAGKALDKPGRKMPA
jgi:hypothetical protein